MKVRFFSQVILASLAVVVSAQTPTLKVGSVAPSLKGTSWIKGTPVEIKKGQVYVVEFWATWCPPCVDSIPHLTKLAKANKNVTFVGISISEDSPKNYGPKTVEKVKKFVKDQGSKMEYHVGMDDKNMTIATNWLKPAGINGIPSAMIIDKKGKIAWIGHPMEMDKPLAKIAKG